MAPARYINICALELERMPCSLERFISNNRASLDSKNAHGRSRWRRDRRIHCCGQRPEPRCMCKAIRSAGVFQSKCRRVLSVHLQARNFLGLGQQALHVRGWCDSGPSCVDGRMTAGRRRETWLPRAHEPKKRQQCGLARIAAESDCARTRARLAMCDSDAYTI